MKVKNISADSDKGSISVGEVEISLWDWGAIIFIITLFLPKPAQRELT